MHSRGAQDPGHTRYYEYNCMDSFFTCLTFVAPAASPRFPTPDEYLRVLEVIARDSSTVTSEQLNLVFKVLVASLSEQGSFCFSP